MFHDRRRRETSVGGLFSLSSVKAHLVVKHLREPAMTRLLDRFSRKRVATSSLGVIYTSGITEEYHNHLTFHFGHWCLNIKLPKWVKPFEQTVGIKPWNQEARKRLNSDHYVVYYPKQYGFTVIDGLLSVFSGEQFYNDISGKSKLKTMHLPWCEYRLVLDQVIGKGDVLHWENPHLENEPVLLARLSLLEERERQISSCPKSKFIKVDLMDNHFEITAHMEHQIWKRGVGMFKWMSWFYPDIDRKLTQITFSPNSGIRRPSWFGGIMTAAVPTEEGESIADVARRYCACNSLGESTSVYFKEV